MYVELAVSDGFGTLTNHLVAHADADLQDVDLSKKYFITQSITEDEYNEFMEMHGGPVAV